MMHTVLFDAGGTLIKTPDFFIWAASQVSHTDRNELAHFLKERFLDLYRDHSQPFRPVEQLLAVVLKQAANNLGVPDKSEQAGEIYRGLFIDQATLYDDTIPTLESLRSHNIRMVIVSDADADVLYEEFNRLSLRPYFDSYVISSEVQAYKPSAPIVQAAREQCREPLHEICMVGDTIMDIHTAHKLGVQAVHIDRRNAPEQSAEHVITSLTELPRIVENR